MLKKLTFIVAAGAIAALVAVPTLASAGQGNPAPASVGGGARLGLICWDAYGNPMPQDSDTCASGSTGFAPANPLSIGDPSEGFVPAATPTTSVSPSPSAPAEPAAVGGQDGVGYMCWDAYGYPMPQDGDTCPDGWTGAPPENPTPTGDPSEGFTP